MQISKRLEAVACMVTPGLLLADIGTDHAYIPIELVRRGVVPQAVAMDINRGPLERAKENIRQCGLSDRIDVRLSDGLEALRPGEAGSIVISGMGGPLTVRILREGANRLSGFRELILQPQSEIRLVREYIEEQGWQISREDMVLEDGKYYPIIGVSPARSRNGTACGRQEEFPGQTGASGREESGEPRYGPKGKMTSPELRYGPVLLTERHPVLCDFLLREQRVKRRILKSLGQGSGKAAATRRREVEQELAIVEEALAYYNDKERIPLQ